MIFTDYWKVLVLTFSEMGNTFLSWAKKLTEIWYLLITGKFLFWTFRWWEIRSFFESGSWWKDNIYWLLRSSCFELFGDGKYGLFFSQKVDGKMIFTWSFWAFHDIPGLGKYGFLHSGNYFFVFVIFTKFVKTSLHSDESNVTEVLLYKNIDTLMTKYWHKYWRRLMF